MYSISMLQLQFSIFIIRFVYVYKKMVQVFVGEQDDFQAEGFETSSSFVFIKSRSLAEPISEDVSMAGPISKLWILPPSALLIDSIAAHRP